MLRKFLKNSVLKLTVRQAAVPIEDMYINVTIHTGSITDHDP